MKKIIELSQFDSLAASSANKIAEVASAASGAIRELAQYIDTPDSDTIIITCSTSEPGDDSYWFYIENDEKLARLKETKINEQRENIYFPTKSIFVEDLNETMGIGGVEINDVSNVVITSNDEELSLSWADPDDVIYNGATLARWAGTKVVRKAGSAPTDINDGTLVVDNTIKNTYTTTAYVDSHLTNNTTYYYKFFPYTTGNTYTAGTTINATPTPKPKATMSLSTNSLDLSKNDISNITITTNSDGELTAISGDTSIVTTSLSGSTVTITAIETGTTVVTVSQAKGTDYSSPDSQIITISVTELSISNTLNNNSWDVISSVSQAGLGDTYWDVGDAKEITLNGKVGNQLTFIDQSLCVFILDFNYKMNGTDENNIIWGGFKSALTGGRDVALVDNQYNQSKADGTIMFNMNHWGTINYDTNYGGWKGCDLRYDVLGATNSQPSGYGAAKTTSCVGYDATAATLTSPKADTLLTALPSELRNVMRLWTRWIDATGNKSNTDAGIKATVDAITLLAEFEVFGSRSCANEYEQNHQTQMAYYKNGNSKIRYNFAEPSTAVFWWEASPYYASTAHFGLVHTNGSATGYTTHTSYALAPAFKT